MFPVRSLALIVATTLATSVPLTAVANAAPAPEAQPHAATYVERTSCWVEKVHSVETAEVICGDPGDRPRSDTADIGEVFATSATDCGYMASWAWRQGFDIAPAGCN